MTQTPFPHLFEPIHLGPTAIRNRVFNPPHGTTLGHQGVVTDELIAYHRARARGGAGLIVLEGMTLHPSYGFEEAFLYAGSDRIIAGLERLGQACREYDTPVFGQLFHAGRAVRLSHDGSRPVTYSASDVPDERYRVVPVPMPKEMVWELIESYASAAARLAEAGLDGVEILSGMGYLVSQFLSPATNHRDDEFGGSRENRGRFLREILSACRERIGADRTLGVRITLDEKTPQGPAFDDVLALCQDLDNEGRVDYFSVIAGSSASPGGWVHVFPPMAVSPGFVIDDAARLKQAVSRPVLVAGRINQPQMAETVLASGQADMVGMVRALIADPEFVNKAARGEADHIRACVGCNQACVGHRLAHHPVSCIQHPVSGREKRLGNLPRSSRSRHVLVAGAGPGGMKAAVVAASLGHRVSLLEKTDRPGGQVRLAEKLPGRAEFGGVITNLLDELERAGVSIELNSEVTGETLASRSPDLVIVAAGATSRLPECDVEDVGLVDARSVITGQADVGQRVVVADWSCDWNGLGVAQWLAQNGHDVRLLSGGVGAGEALQGIVRDQWIGELQRLGVALVPMVRFHGAAGDAAFFEHMTSGEPVVCEAVDTVVSCYAPRANPLRELDGGDVPIVRIGDALSPRTVEEAVLEGFEAAIAIDAGP